MTTAVESSYSGLASIVGDSHLIAEPATCRDYAVDGKVPSLVVFPQSSEQVAAALKCAADRSLGVIPCRSRTKLQTGNPPRRYDVALSLKDLTRVWYYEPQDLVIGVEPGMKLGDLQRFVGRQGLWLPLDPAGGAQASMGGILAANASGPLRTAYGGPRDMVLGMKIATTEGKIVKTGGRVVKNVTGYDISKLMIGSYGTLGVIVEASFKLFPLPAGRATSVLEAGTLDRTRDLRRRLQQSPLQPMRMVWLDAEATKLVRRRSPGAAETRGPELWIEAVGSPRVLERTERTLEEIGRAAGAGVDRLPDANAGSSWSSISNFRDMLVAARPQLTALVKATFPLSSSEEFIHRAQQQVASSRLGLLTLALLGVGVVHLALLEAPPEGGLSGVIEALRAAAASLGGSLVVEWCAPEIKSQTDVWGPPGDDFEVMPKLKDAWDPKGILSPGRFVGRT